MPSPISIDAIGFISANDFPSRDPDTIKMSYRNTQTGEMVPVSTFNLDFGQQRHRTLKFEIKNVESKEFRFDIKNNKEKCL